MPALVGIVRSWRSKANRDRVKEKHSIFTLNHFPHFPPANLLVSQRHPSVPAVDYHRNPYPVAIPFSIVGRYTYGLQTTSPLRYSPTDNS